MDLFKKLSKKNSSDEVELKYKPVPMTPALLQRQYEEECYKKYNITKKHECITK